LAAPKEVEDLRTQLPGVGQAYVAGVPDERMGEVGWAWVVPDGTVDLDPRELIRYCRAHLAPFKVPRKVIFIDAADLPMTTTGKVRKHVLVASAR
jgi:fatty-acyl-CoA synthase